MKKPEDTTLLQRCLLTAAIIVVVLILLSLISCLSEPGESAEPADLYGDIPLDAHLLRADRRALDDAYHDQLVKLFTVWLSQGAGDSTQFRTGLKNTRRAFGLAIQGIAKREHDLVEQEQSK
jgi:hypothetical protein